MPAPSLPGVDWNEVRRIAHVFGIHEAARQTGLNVNAVKARSSREDWFAERDKAKAALQPDQRNQLVAIATNSTVAKAKAVPTLEQIIATNATKSRATAGNVALRALERIERLDDDELLNPTMADVTTKYTGVAAKAGGWESEGKGQTQTVVNIAFLAPPAHDNGAGHVLIDVEGQDSGNEA